MATIKRNEKGQFAKGNKANWQGGVRRRRGYVFIYSPDHPFKDANNCCPEHRLVMEKYLGRYLDSREVVHHIDGKKDNNRIENLLLLPNKAEHKKIHKNVGMKSRFKVGHKTRLKDWVSTEEIVRLRKEGLSYKKIGKRVGLSKSAVINRYKKYLNSGEII